MRKFNVVALGARDYYHVSIALLKKNILGSNLTDFYTPDILRKYVSKRWNDSLPSRFTTSLLPYLILSYLFRGAKFGKIRKCVDFTFGVCCALITLMQRRNAIVYSYYIEGFVWACDLLRTKPNFLLCFQVHPSPWYIQRLLCDDTLKFHSLDSSTQFLPDIENSYSEADMERYIHALRYCDGVICASQTTLDSITEANIDPYNVLIAPYGTRFEAHTENAGRSLFTQPGRTKILTVCQVSQRKGLHWAFTHLKNSAVADDIEWIVVSGKVDPNIQRLAPSFVKFHQKVSESILSATMADADVFVMPSILEGFGLVYIEALGAGTPLLAGVNTGVPDIDPESLVSRSVHPHDRAAFLRALDEVILLSKQPDSSIACKRVADSVTWLRFHALISDFAMRVHGEQ